MVKNIFITGSPGVGKTTLIRRIIDSGSLRKAKGFYTQEIRENGERKGFKVVDLKGREGVLAHINIGGHHKVGKYKVDTKALEEVGIKAIKEGLNEGATIIVDEVGPMELCSESFRKTILEVLDSENKVIGTIKLSKDRFLESIKNREDTKIFHLEKNNFEDLKWEIMMDYL